MIKIRKNIKFIFKEVSLIDMKDLSQNINLMREKLSNLEMNIAALAPSPSSQEKNNSELKSFQEKLEISLQNQESKSFINFY